MDLLDGLVAERGRAHTAEVLEVNYRTLALCCDSRQVSRRMWQALLDLRDSGESGGHGDVAPEVGGGNTGERDGDDLERRVAALEVENAELRELADSQAGRLVGFERRVAALEGEERQPGGVPGRRVRQLRAGGNQVVSRVDRAQARQPVHLTQ